MEVIVVTGGAGFIGSNFIKYMIRVKKEVLIINIDKLTYAGNLENLADIKADNRYKFYHEDICNSRGIDAIFSKYNPNYIVNFAAESHVDRSIENSKVFIETNVLGTQVLMQSALEHGVKKFVQISTDEVYGDKKTETGFTESAPLNPGNPYAASKAAADMLALSYHHTYGQPAVITRCTNNFGPNQHREKLIPLIIDRCLHGNNIPVYGDGRQQRDWIYVEDHCRAILDVLEKGRAGEIYNISADNKIENIVLIKKVVEQLSLMLPEEDSRKPMINDKLISFVEDRKGHDRCYSINAQKIQEQLGWKPIYRFPQALEDTIKWYAHNI